ncbi:MAG: hypothetical protein RR303_06845 [Bacteroidales bacterium]
MNNNFTQFEDFDSLPDIQYGKIIDENLKIHLNKMVEIGNLLEIIRTHEYFDYSCSDITTDPHLHFLLAKVCYTHLLFAYQHLICENHTEISQNIDYIDDLKYFLQLPKTNITEDIMYDFFNKHLEKPNLFNFIYGFYPNTHWSCGDIAGTGKIFLDFYTNKSKIRINDISFLLPGFPKSTGATITFKKHHA